MIRHYIQSCIGKEINMLKIVGIGEPIKTRKGVSANTAIVICKCGVVRNFHFGHLNAGRFFSCGCSPFPKTIEYAAHHLRVVWKKAKSRCCNPKDKDYRFYGARGIRMCAAWLESSKAFIIWALENGWQPGLQLDRKNTYGEYSPSNCRFVPQLVNLANRRPRGKNVKTTQAQS